MTDPATITGLVSWFKADAITGLSDGNPVASWTNSATGGAAATQASSGAKPTWQTNEVNALPVVRFDGGDWLDSTTNCVNTGNGATTVFVVLKPTSGYVVLADTAGADAFQYGLGGGGAQEILKASAASLGASSTTVPTGGFSICSASHINSGTYLFELDGVDDGTGTAAQSLTAAAGTRIGADASGTFGVAGDIAEILIYEEVLSTTDRDAVTAYLGDKYGITVTVAAAPGSPVEDRTIYAVTPPAGSGLAAVAVGGATSQTANLQAALDYVDSEYGGGYVVGAGATAIVCDTGLVIPAGVQLRDITLDFGNLASGTAITCDDTGRTPLSGVKLTGPGSGTSTVGIDVTGARCDYEQIQLFDFGTGVKVTNEDTYIITFHRGWMGSCGEIIDADFDTAGTSNAGEGIRFERITFDNSNVICTASADGLSLFFDRCHLDYSTVYLYASNCNVFYNMCHFETKNFASTNGWLFQLNNNAKVSFANSKFILGSDGTTNTALGNAGLYHILDPSTGPANYGDGAIMWDNCDAYIVGPLVTDTGIQRTTQLVVIPSGLTSATIRTPFATKWAPVTALPAWNDGDGYGTGQAVPRVVVAKDGSNNVTGLVTVSVASAPGADLPIRVIF